MKIEKITTSDQEIEKALQKADEIIEEEELPINKFSGWYGYFITAIAVLMSLIHMYAAYDIVPTAPLRAIHVLMSLVLVFLLYPMLKKLRNTFNILDVCLVLLSLAVFGYMFIDINSFMDRAVTPTSLDVFVGTLLIFLLFEATRRTTGWIMIIVTGVFLAYAFWGNLLPPPWAHRSYDLGRLVGHLYMTLEGIFGVPIGVSATLIILFAIYGAVLRYTGAAKFFIDFSLSAMRGKTAATGQTVVLSSFLLGGPSGSGVATTVTLGSVVWPMLKRAGYSKDAAGGLLAAGGLGAILSPPVMGAAAFLIAEFLKISYLDVIRMAVIPTILFYVGLLIMVNIDVRKYNMQPINIDSLESIKSLLLKHGFHFFSLITIVLFMLYGFSPMSSVFWSTITAALMSFLNRESALTPLKAIEALRAGSVDIISIAITCAMAGIIVGVVTLTGLGLKFSGIILHYAGDSLFLTTLLTALVVWIVGLAVPVTASYIICAVITVPAMTKLGVPDYAAHMFVFYYALLSEVSPPTALSAFAAAAITKGNPYVTTLYSWKYTLPAFLVPFIFVLDPKGRGLLLEGPIGDTVVTSITALIGIAALAVGVQGWMIRKTYFWERILFIVAGFALIFSNPWLDMIGLGICVFVLATQYFIKRVPQP